MRYPVYYWWATYGSGLLQPAVNEFLNSVVFDAESYKQELGEIEVREHSRVRRENSA